MHKINSLHVLYSRAVPSQSGVVKVRTSLGIRMCGLPGASRQKTMSVSVREGLFDFISKLCFQDYKEELFSMFVTI